MISENVVILTYWSYKDALVQTYTLPYVKIIRKHLDPQKKIWLQTLEKEKLSPEKIDEIKTALKQAGINWLPAKFSKYGLTSYVESFTRLLSLIVFCLRNRIKVIHIWCTPPGVIGYIISLVTGAKLIIDSYEPHAEPMVENGDWRPGSLKFRVLFYFEKRMSHRAHTIISATEGMREYARVKYKAEFDRFYVKPACVDLNLFDLKKVKNQQLMEELGLKDKIVLLYAGKFGNIYHDKEIFDFCKVALEYFGEKFRFLLLTSHDRQEIDQYCKEAGMEPSIVISRFVSHSQIADYMGLSDFAITPVKSVPAKRFCTPIKDGEYWALGLPVIITKNISDDSDIIEAEGIGAVLEGLNEDSYLKAVQKMDLLLKSDREQMRLRIRKIAEKYRSFDIAEHIYSQLYH